jgi:hypothetical protein
VHFLSIKPVLSDHLSYVTIFHCSLGRSHKTVLTVYHDENNEMMLISTVLDQHTELDFIVVLSIAIARPGTILSFGNGNNSYKC